MRTNNNCEALDYIKRIFIHEEELLKSANTNLSGNLDRISLDAFECKLLSLFIKMMNVETIVEIGTLAGHSALWMAKSIPESGKVYTIENNPEHQKIAQDNFDKSPYKDKIELICGTLAENQEKLSKYAPFDMIFIDADKGGYCNYLDWAEENIKKDGLIVADNSLLFNSVYLESCPKNISKNSWQVMQEFNKRLADESKYDSLLIPTEEGMTVGIKKF